MILRLRLAVPTVALLALAVSGTAAAQYCPVTSTYFTNNFSRPGCTIGTCWAANPFPGSTGITGSQYPSSNYACATTNPAAGALENTLYTYDGNGNLTTAKDPLGHSTVNSYDALNRLTQVLDPTTKATKYAYNGNNTLVQVTDPRSLNTTYSVNGFGETLQTNSPDTGVTTTAFDPAGRLATKMDARGTLATYTYDDIGRVILETYAGGGSISYTYDQGTYGKGRLTSVQDATTTNITYEAHGRVTQKTQIVGTLTRTVGYHYDAYGRLDQLTYPSGMIVVFGYTNGQVTSINAAGQAVLSGALYSPFGAVKSWTWGNSQTYVRSIDLDGRVTSYPRHTSTQTLGFDNASRITSLTDPSAPTLNQVFGYDVLDRFSSDTPGSGGAQPTRGYTYDPTGNRLTSSLAGVVTSYTTPATTNRLGSTTGGQLATYTYDAMGNILSDGTRTYAYNARGRMNSATKSGQTASYTINAFGQRVRKVTGAATTVYVYDEGGRLLGEYDGAGVPIAEHIYFNGMPVAVMKFVSGSPKVYQVYPDHLGTPRTVVDPVVAKPVWHWHNVDPFGGNLPNENPSGLGNFVYALRFPGQYYDTETGLHYNYLRDYDSTIARYSESDPVGLKAGPNTYAYVANDPIRRIDPYGLDYLSPDGEPPGSGCGDEKTDRKVPDSWIGFSFLAGCRAHDRCYETCGTSKAECDSQFLKDMLKECDSIPWYLAFINMRYRNCFNLAQAYYWAVRTKGGPAYEAAQQKACCK